MASSSHWKLHLHGRQKMNVGTSPGKQLEAGKFVLDPHASSILPVWDSIILLMIVIISFHVPYQVAFRIDAEDVGLVAVVARCVDTTFACDMLIQFFVSYPREEDHRWVRMPNAIVAHYFYGYFFLDILSVFPYDVVSKYITLEMGPRFKFLGLFKLLSLIRLGRVNRLIARYEALVNLPYTHIRLLKLLIVLSFSLHWIACAWGLLFFVETSLGIKIDSTWPQVLRGAKPGMFADPDAYGAFELYTASMYWSCMTITSIGYGDVLANNAMEAWGATIIMALSGLLWANIIGSICAIAGSLDAETAEHENQLDSLNTMMRHLDLPQDLRVQLREFFMCRAGLSFRAKQYELIKAMSPELKGGVARWMQSTMMKKVWFFQDVSNAFAVGLFEHFSFAMYPPREMVNISRSLIFLLSGVVMKSAKILPPGSVWGVDNLILTNVKLQQDSSVLALSYLQLQYLRQSGLVELTLDFPAERKQIRKAAAYEHCGGLQQVI